MHLFCIHLHVYIVCVGISNFSLYGGSISYSPLVHKYVPSVISPLEVYERTFSPPPFHHMLQESSIRPCLWYPLDTSPIVLYCGVICHFHSKFSLCFSLLPLLLNFYLWVRSLGILPLFLYITSLASVILS